MNEPKTCLCNMLCYYKSQNRVKYWTLCFKPRVFYCRLDVIMFLMGFPTFICIALLLFSGSTTVTTEVLQFNPILLSSSLPLPPPPPPPTAHCETKQPLKLHSRHLSKALVDGTNLCPALERPKPEEIQIRHKYWQFDRTDERIEIIIFSAFYDNRPLLQRDVWLRVIGIASIRSNSSLFCHIWYDEFKSPYVTPTVIDWTGRKSGYRFNKKAYIQIQFSCLLPIDIPSPTHVSVVASKCVRATTFMPIQQSVRSHFVHEFGICVPIAFGQISPVGFVEWIEMYKLLGVGEFNVYDSNMVNMTTVFDYYVNNGVLKVHPMPSPVDAEGFNGAKVASAASLNDCMMSNVYRYQFVIVVDFDEFILPRMHDTFSQMLDHIDRKKKKVERHERYSFRNMFFFKDSAPDLSEPSYLQIARYRNRPKSPRASTLPKSFIDPRSCLSVWNHYCLLNLRGKSTFVDVDTPVAVVQHYRRCGLSKDSCRNLLSNVTQDDTALRFTGKLQTRVEDVLKTLNML